MDKLSDTTAVRVARKALAAYEAGGEEAGGIFIPAANAHYWLARVREALRLVLAAIDDAEGGRAVSGTVTLKNGAEVPDVAMRTTMLALRTCLENKPLAFYDLVLICRKEPGYQPFGDNGQYLRSLALLEPSGQPHGVVRDVVLSAVTGGVLDMALGSPLPEATP